MAVYVLFVAVILVTVSVVNCQPMPRFENGRRNLTNNSYIHYGNISDGDNALKCVTDSDNCCNDSRVGKWRDMRGRAVQQGGDEATCFYVTRGHGVISLERKNSCTPWSWSYISGLWRCDIPDSSEVMQSIYIYIVAGQLRMHSSDPVQFILHTEPSISPPEFTIICRTERGPATTVIWRRPNGQKVEQGDSNYETSQIIQDVYNSVYENRLRVRGRESGQWVCGVSNNINDYFHDLGNTTIRIIYVKVAIDPTGLSAINQSNSTHVDVTVIWRIPQDLNYKIVTGFVIYYQAKKGTENSVMMCGWETKRHLLNGLQRGVTYNISIVALSYHLPSPLVGPVTLIPEPILKVKVSPSSIIISPNDQFTMTCTARAEVDGESHPVPITFYWTRITKSPSGSIIMSLLLRHYEYRVNSSPESGYQSILSASENDTVNTIIYHCEATMRSYPSGTSGLDVTVTVEAATNTPRSETTATSTPSSETTATSTPSSEATGTSTSSSEATTTRSSKTTVTSIPSPREESNNYNTAVVTGGVGGVTGLIILIQCVVIVVQHLRHGSKSKSKKRTSTEGEHKMVVTSSNSAYGVVTVREEHVCDEIDLQQMNTHHCSHAGPSH